MSKNPWNLTDKEDLIVTVMLQVGRSKSIARMLGMSARTVEAHCHSIRKKMDVNSLILAALAWDRYLQKQFLEGYKENTLLVHDKDMV